MASDAQLQTDHPGDRGVAEADALRSDSAHGSVEGRLVELVALLAKGSAETSFACDELSKTGRLSPLVQVYLTSIKTFAQSIDQRVISVIMASDAVVPQGSGAQEYGGKDIKDGRPRSRRPKSRAFDFLLLEALHVRPRLTVPVGLDDLKKIAAEFDPEVKPNSLVAKLNRWKHDDKLLDWTSHENMHLTNLGISKRNDLLDLARKTGRLDDVNEAIFKVLRVRSSY